jgi:hypothetical protein
MGYYKAYAAALIAAAKITLGSATVPVSPVETSKIPSPLFALGINMALNCSTNSSCHDPIFP